MSKKNNQEKKISRRNFLEIGAGGLTAVLLAGYASARPEISESKKNMLLYIGTYTSGKSRSEGIYVYKLNSETGELTPYKVVKDVVDPSFLAIDKDRKYLYAVNELVDYEGKKSGAVSAFAIDRKTGDLQFLNKQASLGGAPCHVEVSENGKFVLVANYVGGNFAVFPIEEDGKLGASVDFKQDTGTGPNKDRQEAAHAHSINLDKNNRFAVACDLGMDKAFIYEFDKKSGKLTPNPNQQFFQTAPGAGPRHFAFHRNEKFAFLINEMGSTVTALSYDPKKGTLSEIETVSTLPAGMIVPNNTCAEVQVSPNGKFLYGSNRGHDSIVSYKIDEKNGKLEYIEHVSTKGKNPRNFTITPNGKFLLAANQTSNNIFVFAIDEKTGKLAPTNFSAQVSAPVCLTLVEDFTR